MMVALDPRIKSNLKASKYLCWYDLFAYFIKKQNMKILLVLSVSYSIYCFYSKSSVSLYIASSPVNRDVGYVCIGKKSRLKTPLRCTNQSGRPTQMYICSSSFLAEYNHYDEYNCHRFIIKSE